MPRWADNPFKSGYYSKLDVSLVLGPEEASFNQSFTIVMRWMIDIGWIDINTKVSLLLLSNAKTGAFGCSITYYGLPEAQA